jgi:hypothetical protein
MGVGTGGAWAPGRPREGGWGWAGPGGLRRGWGWGWAGPGGLRRGPGPGMGRLGRGGANVKHRCDDRGMARKPLVVFLEIGSSKAFASAEQWPGWCRAGRNEEAALAALTSYADRFAEVARRAGLSFDPAVANAVEVVERVKGGSTTNFGAPEVTSAAEATKVTPARAKTMVALLEAAWALFDAEAAKAPAELRKGPRGGGRDRDKMVDHVIGAEASYARKLGVRHKQPAIDDVEGIAALRGEILAVLGAPNDGAPPVENGWTTPYAAKRLTWHVLDHLWEMQDRST